MKKTSTVLATLLAVQLLIAAGLWFNSYSNRTVRPQEQFVELDEVTISKLEITDLENNSTQLSKKGDQWVLSENNNLPVDSTRLETLLASITDLKTGWPVATRKNSHGQLEVAEDNFERKVKLYAGDEQQANFYVGSSPGLRQVHARNANSDDVFAVALNSFDMPASAGDWLDKTLLSLDVVTGVKVSDGAITKDGEEWELVVDSESKASDGTKIDNLVNAIQLLRVNDIAESVPDGAETVGVSVSVADQNFTYEFHRQDGNHFVTRGDYEAVFGISQAAFDNIAGSKFADLAVVVPEELETTGQRAMAPESQNVPSETE